MSLLPVKKLAIYAPKHDEQYLNHCSEHPTIVCSVHDGCNDKQQPSQGAEGAEGALENARGLTFLRGSWGSRPLEP